MVRKKPHSRPAEGSAQTLGWEEWFACDPRPNGQEQHQCHRGAWPLPIDRCSIQGKRQDSRRPYPWDMLVGSKLHVVLSMSEDSVVKLNTWLLFAVMNSVEVESTQAHPWELRALNHRELAREGMGLGWEEGGWGWGGRGEASGIATLTDRADWSFTRSCQPLSHPEARDRWRISGSCGRKRGLPQHRCPEKSCSPSTKKVHCDNVDKHSHLLASLSNACTRLPSQTSPHYCSPSWWEKAWTLQQLRAFRPLQRSYHLWSTGVAVFQKDTLASNWSIGTPHSENLSATHNTTQSRDFHWGIHW